MRLLGNEETTVNQKDLCFCGGGSCFSAPVLCDQVGMHVE